MTLNQKNTKTSIQLYQLAQFKCLLSLLCEQCRGLLSVEIHRKLPQRNPLGIQTNPAFRPDIMMPDE